MGSPEAIAPRNRLLKTGAALGGIIGLLSFCGPKMVDTASASNNISVTTLKSINSLGEATEKLCLGESRDDCEVVAKFDLRTVEDGSEQPWVNITVPAGNFSAKLVTVVKRQNINGNNWLYQVPSNPRLGMNMFAVKGIKDSFGLVFALRDIATGYGPDIGKLGHIRSYDPFGIPFVDRSKSHYRQVFAVPSKVEGDYTPPLTDKPEKALETAKALGIRVLFGANG